MSKKNPAHNPADYDRFGTLIVHELLHWNADPAEGRKGLERASEIAEAIWKTRSGKASKRR